MGLEKDLKKQFIKNDKEQKKAKKQQAKDEKYNIKLAQKEEKEKENFLRECELLAQKINEMTPNQYDSFITETIRRIVLTRARAIDKETHANNIKSSINDRALTERQKNIILISHTITLATLGAMIGATIGDTESERLINSCIGLVPGVIGGGAMGFSAYLALEDKKLINFLKKARIKILEKKATKLKNKANNKLNQFQHIKKVTYNPKGNNKHKEIAETICIKAKELDAKYIPKYSPLEEVEK